MRCGQRSTGRPDLGTQARAPSGPGADAARARRPPCAARAIHGLPPDASRPRRATENARPSRRPAAGSRPRPRERSQTPRPSQALRRGPCSIENAGHGLGLKKTIPKGAQDHLLRDPARHADTIAARMPGRDGTAVVAAPVATDQGDGTVAAAADHRSGEEVRRVGVHARPLAKTETAGLAPGPDLQAPRDPVPERLRHDAERLVVAHHPPRLRLVHVPAAPVAIVSVSGSVAVSPSDASCTDTATTAPVSMSTPCSTLWVRCVRPSFIFAIFASGSCRDCHSLFDVFLSFRDRSKPANSARVGVANPDAFANRRTPVSRRSMLRIAAFASNVVASLPTVFPRNRPASATRSSTHVKTASCVSSSIRRRVRDSVEWSGAASVKSSPRNDRRLGESATRHAIPRSDDRPSKNPMNSNRQYRPGRRLGRPSRSA